MAMRRSLSFGGLMAAALVLAGCVGGPPSPEAIAGEFATPIESAWVVDVPGIYGEPTIVDGVVLVYADDEEVGMRLSAFDLETGESLWEHTSSPGGAFANPILASVDAASRPYPLPTIKPLVVETGDGDAAAPAVVFFERDIPEEGSIAPDDFLRVADLKTGELLEVTVPGFDPEEFTFEPLGINDEGDVYANVVTPPAECGDEVCWVANDPDTSHGHALIALDPATLEARYEAGFLPDTGETITPDWGPEYVRISEDGVEIARYVDGEQLWRIDSRELFEVERTIPPDYGGIQEIGDLVLIQGYQSIRETLAPDRPHTLDLDFATSRTLVAVDRESGEVVWRVPGGDMLCHAVHQATTYREADEQDAESIPICLATAGSFLYDIEADQIEQEDIVASLAELNLATGEIGWELPDLGIESLAHVGRLTEVAYSVRGDLAVAGTEEATFLADLRAGETYPMPDDAAYVCKSERADVELKFEGSVFAGGSNPITTGYPAGWYQFACDDTGEPVDDWTKGAVRVAGYSDPAGEGSMVVLPLEGSLAGFKL
jgi:outer membrane protein assembly factor BamB